MKKFDLPIIYYAVIGLLPERLAVCIDYTRRFGKPPRLKPPQTYNEKIAWRKLYEKDPRFIHLVDKVKVKEIISAQYGANFIKPNLCVCDKPEELPFDSLKPPYVIKVSHSSGKNIFVKDSSFDRNAIIKSLRRQLRYNHARRLREWAYGLVPRRILVEPFLDSGNGQPPNDYKIHVFRGRVYMIELFLDHSTPRFCNFYTPQWEPVAFQWGKYPASKEPQPRPANLDEMLRYAAEIGKDFSYSRVDLYSIGGKTLFGEITFYPDGGCEKFHPEKWDYIFGAQWKI